MKDFFRYLLCALLLLCGGNLHAQNEFNPTNPAEPNLRLYQTVTVASYPAGAGYVSGGGRLLEGSSQALSTSSRNVVFEFSHWTLNGEYYSSSAKLNYIVGTEAMDFVAHYDYNPTSPQEPSQILKNTLTLVPYPANACTFNRTSGTRVEYDTWVSLKATAGTGFDFIGWYNNDGALVSNSLSFNYQMPDKDVTLTARFNYNPFNPDEPFGDGSQTNVQTTARGDVNKDSVVDLQDVVVIMNTFLGKAEGEDKIVLCDINGDGVVDMEDIVIVLNIFLKK